MDNYRITVLCASVMVLMMLPACGDQGEQPALEDQEAASELAGPNAQEMNFPVWIGEFEAWARNMVPAGEGWLVACQTFVPRQYGYGQLFMVSGSGEILWSRDFYESDLELWEVVALSDGDHLLVGTDSPTWDEIQEAEMMDGEMLYDESGEPLGAMSYDAVAQFWACRVDPSGETVWKSVYHAGEDAFCCGAVQCDNDDIILAGDCYMENGGSVFRLIRVDPGGSLVWDSTYSSTAGYMCKDIAGLAEGGFLLGGDGGSFSGEAGDILLVKTDGSGDVVWSLKYRNTDHNQLASMAVTGEGGILISGTTTTLDGLEQNFLAMLDSSGEQIWTRYFFPHVFNDIIITDEEEIIICGDATVISLDMEGNTLWERTLEEFDSGEIVQAQPFGQGEIMVLGYAYPPSGDGPLACLTVVERGSGN